MVGASAFCRGCRTPKIKYSCRCGMAWAYVFHAGEARPDLDRSGLIGPEDIADAVEFLLRQEGNAVTDLVQVRRKANAPW